MSKLISIFLSIVIGLSTVSCKTFRSDSSKIEPAQIIKYIEPASYFACKSLLEHAVNEADRREKAEQVFVIARAIRALADGTVPTAEELEEVIKLWSPKKSHWAQFATELSMVYERFYENVSAAGQNALIFEALGELAEGCEKAAKPYITIEQFENYQENIEGFQMQRSVMKATVARPFL